MRRLLLAFALLLAGCGDPTAVNEAHPHYRTGMDHREAGRFEQAVDAFELCLAQSPRSEKAHLQLAMLYEDNLNNPLLAVYHYRQFLERTDDETQKTLVSEWLIRTEKQLRDDLMSSYPLTPPPELIPISAPGSVANNSPSRPNQARTTPSIPAPSPPPAPTPPAPPRPAFDAYVVQSGDNLSRIARKTLGSETKWQVIYDANRDTLPSPGQLRIGQTLRIPKQ